MAASKSSNKAASSGGSPSKATKRNVNATEPTSDESLLALDSSYTSSPDIPVAVAVDELKSLARLATGQLAKLSKIGIGQEKIVLLSSFAARLSSLEKAWQKARSSVKLTAAEKKLVAEAEALDTKLVAGGRWACRGDSEAQSELTRIAEGSGLADTIQDLRDLVEFWGVYEARRSSTNITEKNIARATELADKLDAAAAKEGSDVDAAAAIDLRNRAFWAGDELAKEIREGGRYAFSDQPKIAAKFGSRYRISATRRSRRKAKASSTTSTSPG